MEEVVHPRGSRVAQINLYAPSGGVLRCVKVSVSISIASTRSIRGHVLQSRSKPSQVSSIRDKLVRVDGGNVTSQPATQRALRYTSRQIRCPDEPMFIEEVSPEFAQLLMFGGEATSA